MTGVIIQARIGSTRLPKKVIKKLEGKTVLEHVILRIKRVKNCDKVILAISDKKENDILEKIAKNLSISVFRGSENDVLDRYYKAAKLFKIDPIVRITADCPTIDPKIVERVIDFYFKNNYDYVSNVRPPTFPDGMDVEIFNFKSLKKSWQEAKLKSEKEHVVAYIVKNSKIFKIGNVTYNKKDFSNIRLSLDEKADLILLRKVFKELYHKNHFFGLKEILRLFERKSKLKEINQEIQINEGYLKALKEDEKIK